MFSTSLKAPKAANGVQHGSRMLSPIIQFSDNDIVSEMLKIPKIYKHFSWMINLSIDWILNIFLVNNDFKGWKYVWQFSWWYENGSDDSKFIIADQNRRHNNVFIIAMQRNSFLFRSGAKTVVFFFIQSSKTDSNEKLVTSEKLKSHWKKIYIYNGSWKTTKRCKLRNHITQVEKWCATVTEDWQKEIWHDFKWCNWTRLDIYWKVCVQPLKLENQSASRFSVSQ